MNHDSKPKLEIWLVLGLRKGNNPEEWRGIKKNAENQTTMQVFDPYDILVLNTDFLTAFL